MDGRETLILFAPLLLTGGLWMAFVFAVDAYVSRMWADLGGLLLIVVLPFVYRSIASAIDGDWDRS